MLPARAAASDRAPEPSWARGDPFDYLHAPLRTLPATGVLCSFLAVVLCGVCAARRFLKPKARTYER